MRNGRSEVGTKLGGMSAEDGRSGLLLGVNVHLDATPFVRPGSNLESAHVLEGDRSMRLPGKRASMAYRLGYANGTIGLLGASELCSVFDRHGLDARRPIDIETSRSC